MFKNMEELSPSLNRGLLLFIERMDMDQRDRELFYDIVGFAFDEGMIKGKEQYLKDELKTHKENGQ